MPPLSWWQLHTDNSSPILFFTPSLSSPCIFCFMTTCRPGALSRTVHTADEPHSCLCHASPSPTHIRCPHHRHRLATASHVLPSLLLIRGWFFAPFNYTGWGQGRWRSKNSILTLHLGSVLGFKTIFLVVFPSMGGGMPRPGLAEQDFLSSHVKTRLGKEFGCCPDTVPRHFGQVCCRHVSNLTAPILTASFCGMGKLCQSFNVTSMLMMGK